MMETIYVKGMTLDELISLFNCNISNDYDFYDVVAFNIVEKSPNFFFDTEQRNYSNTQFRAIISALVCTKATSQKLFDYLESYLQSEDPVLISEVLDAYRLIGENSKWNVVKKLLDHCSPCVRSAALRYCRFCLSKEDAFQILICYLTDAHYIVRENAVEELGQLYDKKAIEYLLPLCKDENEHVQMAARGAIEKLSESDG